MDQLNPGQVLDCMGIDYTEPMLIKSGPVHRPVFKKAYVGVFVCFVTKSIDLELVSDLSTLAFIATLHVEASPAKIGAIMEQTSSMPSRKSV